MFERGVRSVKGSSRPWVALGMVAALFSPDKYPDPVQRGVDAGFRLAESGDCRGSIRDEYIEVLAQEHRPLRYVLPFVKARNDTCARAESMVDFR
ncbi:MAG: hypothetical protein V4449_01215 [Patescibacteria group bacterium]